MKLLCSALAISLIVGVSANGLAEPAVGSAEAYNRGQEFFSKRMHRQALEAFIQATVLDSTNARAYRATGHVYREMRNYHRAAAAYDAALAVDPGYTAARLDKGLLQLSSLKDFEGAQATFLKVLEADSGYAEGKVKDYLKAAYAKQGGAEFGRKNYAASVEQYRLVAELDPNDAAVHYNLGMACRRSGQLHHAEAALKRSIELGHRYARVHKALGDVYRDLKRIEEAVAAYRVAVEADPKMAASHLSLAATLLDADQAAEASELLEKADLEIPGNADIQAVMGFAYASQKAYDRAIVSYMKSLDGNGANAEVHYRLAVAYLETSRYYEARASATRALRSASYRVPANAVLGDAYAALGDTSTAVHHYSNCLSDRRYATYAEDRIRELRNRIGQSKDDE